MNHKAYYSLLQYCPDASRLETVNVGVLLFCPEIDYLKMRIAGGNDRPRRFFQIGSVEQKRLSEAKAAFENRLQVEKRRFKGLVELEKFAKTRANELRLSEIRSMKVDSPEEELKELFDKLVGIRAVSDKRVTHTPELRQLRDFFDRSNLKYPIEFGKDLIVPISGKTITVPYYFRNGQHQFILPEVFSAQEKPAIDKAERLALEGALVAKHPLEDGLLGNLRVVATFDHDKATTGVQERVLAVLRDFQVKVYTRVEVPILLDELNRELAA